MPDQDEPQNDAPQTDETTDAQDQQDDGLKTALQKERDARKAAEKREKDLSKRLSDLENAGRSESDKVAAERDAAQARADRLAATVRTANGREATRSAAKDAGAPDPDLVYRLIKADIDFDDDDEPTNIDRLLLDAKKEFPDLFKVKPGKADTGGESAKGQPTGKQDMNSWIRQSARR